MLAFLIDNWVLVLAALTSGGLLLVPTLRYAQGGSGSVSVSEAVRLINREKGVLVDISTAAEFAAGHASGARHIAAEQLAATPLPSGLPSNKALPVLLMCASGQRSQKAAQALRSAGYERALSVQGGLQAWREAQMPIDKQSA